MQNPDRSKLSDSSRRSKEKLQSMYGLGHLRISDVPKITDSLGSFEVDHLSLVSKPAV